jgi:UDP-N-acetylglucosamine transferase subunit ALG13
VIFVTVGTQLPFDRLIEAVDAWAGTRGAGDVFAQIGPSGLVPRHIESAPFISPAECRERMREADAIVAHAGMGTILSALQLGKPLLVMPRMASLGEHRNEHQSATAQRFEALGRVAIAPDSAALAIKLDELHALTARERISPYASDRLIGALSTFING